MAQPETLMQRLADVDAHLVNALAQLHRARNDPDERRRQVDQIDELLIDLKSVTEEQGKAEGEPNASILVGIRLDAMDALTAILIAERRKLRASPKGKRPVRPPPKPSRR